MEVNEIQRLNAQVVELERRIGNSEVGNQHVRFCCPILQVEEVTEVCKGHIRPRSVGGGTWVVQRKDVDNFFGSFAEANFNHGVKLRSMEFEDAVKYVNAHRLAAPAKLTMIDDEGNEANIRPIKIVEGMQKVVVRPKQPAFNANGQMKVRMDFDVRYESLLTCLHTTHLGLFKVNRYNYVFSGAGDYLALLLGNVFRRFAKSRTNKKRDIQADRRTLAEMCQCHKNMARPLLNPEVFIDEVREHTFRSFMVCWCNGFPFASMHIVQADSEWNAVMVYEGLNEGAIAHAVSERPVTFKVTLGRYHDSYTEVGPLTPDSIEMDWPCGTNSDGIDPIPIEVAVQRMRAMN